MGFDAFVGAMWPTAVRLLDGLAQAREARGEYGEARKLCERAVRILERSPSTPRRDKLRVRCLSHLGTLDRIEARYDQAEGRLRQALDVASAVFGRRHLETSTLLNNLAVVHKHQGRFLEAKRLYLRSLAITRECVGPDHVRVATIYHNLGGLEHARGRPATRASVCSSSLTGCRSCTMRNPRTIRLQPSSQHRARPKRSSSRKRMARPARTRGSARTRPSPGSSASWGSGMACTVRAERPLRSLASWTRSARATASV